MYFSSLIVFHYDESDIETILRTDSRDEIVEKECNDKYNQNFLLLISLCLHRSCRGDDFRTSIPWHESTSNNQRIKPIRAANPRRKRNVRHNRILGVDVLSRNQRNNEITNKIAKTQKQQFQSKKLAGKQQNQQWNSTDNTKAPTTAGKQQSGKRSSKNS